MAIHTIQDLRQRQALPLEVKILMSKTRIREWINEYGEDGVYISFSGGKDSTVLLDLVREDYPGVKAMFVDTGLEYPEIRDFVKTFDNVDIVKPKMSFKQVIEKYGYPFISKEVSEKVYNVRTVPDGYAKKYFIPANEGGKDERYNLSKYRFLIEAPFYISSNCCKIMKKRPAHDYEKETGRVRITGQMADESMLRTSDWLRNGCNGFNMNSPRSNPLSFWTQQDILRYIKEKNLKICSVYGNVVPVYGEDQLPNQIDFSDLGFMEDTRQYKTTGCDRTGCMFCGYGCHLEKESRFERMKITHPKLYDYIMRPKDQGGLNYKEVIDWINENGNLNIRY